MLPPIAHKFLALTIGADQVTCSLFEQQKSSYTLHAYSRIATHLGNDRSTLFNPTNLLSHIAKFCAQQRIKNSFVGFAVSGKPIIERVLMLTKASPQEEDFFAVEPALKKMSWDARYLYATDDGRFAFYVVGMPRELVAQYKLMAAGAGLNLVSFTTEFSALLQVYKLLEGSTQRQHALAAQVMGKPAFSTLLTPQACVRALHIPPILSVDLSKEAPFIMKSFGLVCSGDTV